MPIENQPLNVLFLSQRVPLPPDRGDRITTCHFLKHFLALGARVRVGALCEEDRDAASVETLRGMVDAVCAPRIHPGRRRWLSLRGLLTGEPLTLPYFRHPELAQTVERWIAEDPPDVVYVYSSSMAQYVLAHDELFRFMQFAELDSDKWRQYATVHRGPKAWVYRREAKLLLEFERRVAREFTACAVVSEVEKALFQQLILDVTPLVLRNGVDVDHFVSAGESNREPHTVIFTGVMDYEPNVEGVSWFAEACWPAIRARLPDAKFLVVGSRPCEAIQRLHGRDGIEVLGRVPEIPPFLDRAAVAVAPLRLARGVQNKVLEAMSTALPVVASPQAAQGLGVVDADTLRVAADAETTTRMVLELIENPERAREIGERAARFVREHYLWEDQYGPFDALMEAELGSDRGDRVSGDGTRPAP